MMEMVTPERDNLQADRAMRVSLAIGLLMLAAKSGAYILTSSVAILSDAAEAFIDLIAIAIAAFSLRLSYRPADERFRYGYERVSFFSAGFEGALIIFAAVLIVFEAIHKWSANEYPDRLGAGTILIAVTGIVNLLVGMYLVRTGRKLRNLILEAHGKHVLTDCWTDAGVVAGLSLAIWSGWRPFDVVIALAVAANILISGGRLLWHSVRGLMDYADPLTGERIAEAFANTAAELGVHYHDLRFRHTGNRTMIDVHLLFPFATPVGNAHRLATELEDRVASALDVPVEITSHLESIEDHDAIHHGGRSGAPDDLAPAVRGSFAARREEERRGSGRT